jgi:hypothetical protein
MRPRSRLQTKVCMSSSARKAAPLLVLQSFATIVEAAHAELPAAIPRLSERFDVHAPII